MLRSRSHSWTAITWCAPAAHRVAQLLVSRVTHSTWLVIGNISTGCATIALYPCCSINAKSRARTQIAGHINNALRLHLGNRCQHLLLAARTRRIHYRTSDARRPQAASGSSTAASPQINSALAHLFSSAFFLAFSIAGATISIP